MTNNLPEPDDAPWLNLTPQEVEELRYNKQKLTDYGKEKIRALMEEKKLLKECRQTGRTTATTEKVLKTVFSQMTDKKTLECEIEEYALGIEQKAKEIGKLKDILDRKEQQLKQMKETDKVLIEMENHPSPVEEAYKRFFGRYPNSGDCWTDDNEEFWYFFQVGYKSAKEDCKVVEEPEQATLYDVVRHGLEYSISMCDEIVDSVRCWLPNEMEHDEDLNGYRAGWNDCINTLNKQLR